MAGQRSGEVGVSTRFAIGLAIAFTLALALPLGTLSDYSLGVLALVTAYAVAALAQNLLSGYADIPSLGNVAFFAASAYTAAGLITLARLPVGIALLGGIAAAGLLGLCVGLPALRISGMHLAIVTVALVFVCAELMTQFDENHIEASSGITISTPDWLLGARGLYIGAICIAAVCYVLIWNLLRSRTGRAITALSDNPYAAAAAGIDGTRHRLLAFVLSGVLTGVAGSIFLYYSQTVTPGAFPLDLSLAFLTMMILGGSRSIGGSIVGALIIGLLPQFLKLFPNQIGSIDVQNSLYGLYALLLLATLRFFPEGIWNVLARAAGRLQRVHVNPSSR
jgi:branched-chain amino acid transport system permease protein